MAVRHWNDDELIAQLLCGGPADRHLESCEECRARLERLQLRREELLSGTPEVPGDFLARQRHAIFRRLEAKPRLLRLETAPVLALLLLVLVILSVFRPVPPSPPADVASDAMIFEDVFNTAARTEPAAVEPVQSLFEVQQ
jgi:hypothetical protein